MDISLELSDIVKRIYETTGLKNLSSVASSIGMHKTAPTNWKAKNKIPGEVLIKIAEIHNCSIDYLVFGSSRIDNLNVFEEAFGNALTALVAAECIDVTDTYEPEIVREVMENMVQELEQRKPKSKIELLGSARVSRK